MKSNWVLLISSLFLFRLPGAVGAQDDSEMLRAKLAAGGTVNLDAGRIYTISSHLTIGPNTNLTCSGGEATIRMTPDFPSGTAIMVEKGSANHITNVSFDGQNAPKLTALLFISDSADVTVSHCKFMNTVAPFSSLLIMRNSHQVSVSDSSFSDSVEGIFLYLTNSNVTISNNEIHDVHNFGIRLQGSNTENASHVDIFGNHIWNVQRLPGKTAGHLIYVNIGQGVDRKHEYITVKDNKLKGVDKGFASLGNADLIEFQDVSHGDVEGNTVEKGGDVGIAIVRSDSVVVNNNHAGYNNTNGICIFDSSNCSVSNNFVYDNDQNRDRLWTDAQHKGGIRVMVFKGSADDNTIFSNHIYDDQGGGATQDYGIYVAPQSRNTHIGANDIHNNRLGDVKDEGVDTQRKGGSR